MARRRKTRKTARSVGAETKRLKAKLNSIAKVAAVSSGAKKTRAKKKTKNELYTTILGKNVSKPKKTRVRSKKKVHRGIVIYSPSSASGIVPRNYTPSSRQLTG